jgi:chemotaxis protein histidine kinase CheA
VGATAEGIPLILAQLPLLTRDGNRNQVYFARFGLVDGYLQEGKLALAAEQLAWLERAMTQNKTADRELAELARLQALHDLARGDASAAQAHIDTMNRHAAALPRRARAEVMRAGLAIAEVALARGDRATATRALDEAAAAERIYIGVAPLPQHSAWRGEIFVLRARLHVLAGETDDARREARKALEQFADTLRPEHPWRREAERLAAQAPAA